jgi:DNA-binding ferritin-like protein
MSKKYTRRTTRDRLVDLLEEAIKLVKTRCVEPVKGSPENMLERSRREFEEAVQMKQEAAELLKESRMETFGDLEDAPETDDVPDAKTMMTRLLQENNILRASLLTAYKTADTTGEVGISNFLQDRIQAHEKHSWMLRSILK